MAGGEDQERRDPGKGFAGLSSMVSNVDSVVAQEERDSKASATPAVDAERASSASSTNRDASSLEVGPYQLPPQGRGRYSPGKWLLGICAVVGVLWIVSESREKASSPAAAYSPRAEPTATASARPTWQPSVTQPQTPSRPSEERPPIGTNNVLSVAQIRYCLAEDVRMRAAKGSVSQYNGSDVDRFNGMVADYNSRCSSFQYRSGALESARSEVVRFQTELEAEGRERFRRESLQGSVNAEAGNESLRESVAPALTSEDRGEASTQFGDVATRQQYEQWLEKTSAHLIGIGDLPMRRDFLQMVWYESMRAGLDPSLVLGLIQVASGFRKFAVSESGARGYMQVASHWVADIGDGDRTNLFNLRSNLRFGCVILRNYQESANGDVRTALHSYYDQANGRFAAISNVSVEKFASSVLEARNTWSLVATDSEGVVVPRELPAPAAATRLAPPDERAAPAVTVNHQETRPDPFPDQAVARPSDGASGRNPQETAAPAANSDAARPDLSVANTYEQTAIERACDTTRRIGSTNAYYACLSRELSSLRSSDGRPSLALASEAEKAAIERACETTQRISGPATYYKCLSLELSGLRSSGGRPDMSGASAAEQASIERACNPTQSTIGPGVYYGCLRRELIKLGHR